MHSKNNFNPLVVASVLEHRDHSPSPADVFPRSDSRPTNVRRDSGPGKGREPSDQGEGDATDQRASGRDGEQLLCRV